MSKVAKDEKHKLRAAFYNNVATGLVLAGVVLPFLTVFYLRLPDAALWFEAYWRGHANFSGLELFRAVGACFGTLPAIMLASIFRGIADGELNQISDD